MQDQYVTKLMALDPALSQGRQDTYIDSTVEVDGTTGEVLCTTLSLRYDGQTVLTTKPLTVDPNSLTATVILSAFARQIRKFEKKLP